MKCTNGIDSLFSDSTNKAISLLCSMHAYNNYVKQLHILHAMLSLYIQQTTLG